MKISVFGMGYVGVVTAACLARDGHEVIGVDVVDRKVELINGGKSPILEGEIDDLISDGVATGRLRATTDAAKAVSQSQLGLVCVGTPSARDGSHELGHLKQVISEIGQSLKMRTGYFDVIVRSTVPPGTCQSLVIPLLEEIVGRPAGDGFDVIFHPEFLREGSSVRDYDNPPKVVIGERIAGCGSRLAELYDGFTAPMIHTSLKVAEISKLIDNSFHALKITFANEVGMLCKELEIDSRAVMGLVQADTKLNISPAYLRPGFAFGGSCLPKDLRSALHIARQKSLSLPMAEGVLESNQRQIEALVSRILSAGRTSVGVVGLSFKPGTDDMRESPLVELVERLLGKGLDVKVYDPLVHEARLVGRNKDYIEQHLPHVSQLLTHDCNELDTQNLIIIGHPLPAEIVNEWLCHGHKIIDLVGVQGIRDNANYSGLYW